MPTVLARVSRGRKVPNLTKRNSRSPLPKFAIGGTVQFVKCIQFRVRAPGERSIGIRNYPLAVSQKFKLGAFLPGGIPKKNTQHNSACTIQRHTVLPIPVRVGSYLIPNPGLKALTQCQHDVMDEGVPCKLALRRSKCTVFWKLLQNIKVCEVQDSLITFNNELIKHLTVSRQPSL